jgi:hypothetical protein
MPRQKRNTEAPEPSKKTSKRVRDESASKLVAPQKRRIRQETPKQNPPVVRVDGKSGQVQTRPLACQGQGRGSAMIL